ncbi:Uncharacterised protein [Vibrio cholerae]|nr:Uncharacterised protein [Vibrio cholerae]
MECFSDLPSCRSSTDVRLLRTLYPTYHLVYRFPLRLLHPSAQTHQALDATWQSLGDTKVQVKLGIDAVWPVDVRWRYKPS